MVMNRGLHLIPPPPRWQVNLAKAIGATMWCWIFWRLKQDWRDLMVSDMGGVIHYISIFSVYYLWYYCTCIVRYGYYPPEGGPSIKVPVYREH